MATVTTTSFSAGAAILAGPARLNAVWVDQATAGSSANTFLMIYDQTAAPIGATDTPDHVLKLNRVGVEGTKGRYKWIFNGDRFATGLGIFLATAFNGATGATTTAPAAVTVDFTPEI